MLEYRFLKTRGALHEAGQETAAPGMPALGGISIDPAAVALVPEAVARESVVMPLTCDGETLRNYPRT